MKKYQIKTFITLAFIILILSQTFSQEKDTTELKMGDKKILIIDESEEIEEGITELRKGVIDFKIKIKNFNTKIDELNDSIDLYNNQLKDAKTEEDKEILNKKIEESEDEIADYTKKIEAFEKGIEQIENEIDDLSQELAEINEEENFDFNIDDLSKKKRKRFKGHWAGFEFGINNYTDKNFKMQLPENGQYMELNTNKSWGFGLNFLQYSIPLFSKYTGFVTGMGFEWNNYRLKQNINLIDSAGVIIAEDSDIKFNKNTLNSVYFNIPIIYEFQIPTGKKDNRFFCGIGVYGGVKIGSKTKKFYELDGDEKDIKAKGDYQLSPLKYGLTTRLGYEFIEIFANYNLVPLFEKNKGPELYPFTIGLRVDF